MFWGQGLHCGLPFLGLLGFGAWLVCGVMRRPHHPKMKNLPHNWKFCEYKSLFGLFYAILNYEAPLNSVASMCLRYCFADTNEMNVMNVEQVNDHGNIFS